jgi:NADH dehydrogenase FAD-containing subunit
MKEWLLSREEGIEKYSKYSKEVKESNNIVLIGGGAVGTETAAEIATDFPDKKVTIIHGGKQLVLAEAPSKFHSRIRNRLEQMKIEVIYDEKVENVDDLPNVTHGSYEIKTNKGTVRKADLIIKTTGLKVNSAAYSSSLADKMTANGALKVNEFLQVEGLTDVFAIGDCNDVKVAKLAFVAALQAQLMLENLKRLLNNCSMKPWDNGCVSYLMGLSLGRNHGVLCTIGGWMLPEFIIVSAKCKDMMVGRYYGEMNQKIPE